jgi:hypothetical protein
MLAPLILFLLVTAIAAGYLGYAWRGRRFREVVLLCGYFLISGLGNWLFLGCLDTDSGLDPWMCFVGPLVVPWPFGVILAGLIPSLRPAGLRSALAGISAVALSFGWLVISEMFI